MRAALALTMLAALGVAGCEAGVTSGATGVVVERDAKETRYGGREYFVLTIREDWGGKLDRVRVSEEVGERCPEGAAWPACRMRKASLAEPSLAERAPRLAFAVEVGAYVTDAHARIGYCLALSEQARRASRICTSPDVD